MCDEWERQNDTMVMVPSRERYGGFGGFQAEAAKQKPSSVVSVFVCVVRIRTERQSAISVRSLPESSKLDWIKTASSTQKWLVFSSLPGTERRLQMVSPHRNSSNTDYLYSRRGDSIGRLRDAKLSNTPVWITRLVLQVCPRSD